jgi:hypothetical protein
MPTFNADKNKPSQEIERPNERLGLDAFMMRAIAAIGTHGRFEAVKMDGRTAGMEG